MRLATLAVLTGFLAMPAAAETIPVPLFGEVPTAGTLTHDHVVLVTALEGQCPATHKGKAVQWFHIVIGGNDHQDISRSTRKCVIVADAPLKNPDAGWTHDKVPNVKEKTLDAPPPEKQHPKQQTAAANTGVLDSEPGPGQLGKGQTVRVRHSDKHKCPAGQIVQVTGASGKEGRRTRECVAS